MSEITTFSVLEAASNGFSKSLGYNSVSEKDFYSWLNSVKADAWEEGHDTGYELYGACERGSREDRIGLQKEDNPYRTGGAE